MQVSYQTAGRPPTELSNIERLIGRYTEYSKGLPGMPVNIQQYCSSWWLPILHFVPDEVRLVQLARLSHVAGERAGPTVFI